MGRSSLGSDNTSDFKFHSLSTHANLYWAPTVFSSRTYLAFLCHLSYLSLWLLAPWLTTAICLKCFLCLLPLSLTFWLLEKNKTTLYIHIGDIREKKNDLRNEDKWEELKLERSVSFLYSGSLKGTVLPRELCSDIRHLPPAIHISITMLPDWLIVTCHWAKARRRQNNLGKCRITLPTEILNKTKKNPNA